MAAVCTEDEGGDDGKCKHPCDPEPPSGAGPWRASVPPVNNMHREYIEVRATASPPYPAPPVPRSKRAV